jgi:hypothetical protein
MELWTHHGILIKLLHDLKYRTLFLVFLVDGSFGIHWLVSCCANNGFTTTKFVHVSMCLYVIGLDYFSSKKSECCRSIHHRSSSSIPQRYDHADPYLIKHGNGRMIPRLDVGLHTMKVGGTLTDLGYHPN